MTGAAMGGWENLVRAAFSNLILRSGNGAYAFHESKHRCVPGVSVWKLEN